MKGDFTRNTFNPKNHFARVLMQQGRVQLDSDWNEQSAILLHYLQTLAADLIGPHGGPANNLGFGIQTDDRGEDFAIGSGRYYVDGILCENEGAFAGEPITYANQPDYPEPPELSDLPLLVYLDVWERHLTYVQEPGIREVALKGPDTATRSKVVWQVKTVEGRTCPSQDEWAALVESWQPTYRGRLKAQAKLVDENDEDPCITPPDSRYRGTENQLYRVEIHRGGTVEEATFKFSRENGSVIFPILKAVSDAEAETTTVYLDDLGRDARFSLQEEDWVELVDDAITLHGKAENLMKISYVDHVDNYVILEGLPGEGGLNPDYRPLLRRWDHSSKKPNTTLGYPALADDGALKLAEDDWLLLEDGIQIYFESEPNNNAQVYRTGDYWLIPARTATGDVEWPGPSDDPDSVPPLGIEHHYAPLAIIITLEDEPEDCRCRLLTLCEVSAR
jgi:hypothetical protein